MLEQTLLVLLCKTDQLSDLLPAAGTRQEGTPGWISLTDFHRLSLHLASSRGSAVYEALALSKRKTQRGHICRKTVILADFCSSHGRAQTDWKGKAEDIPLLFITFKKDK